MILDQDNCRPFDATRAGLNLGEGLPYRLNRHHLPQRGSYDHWQHCRLWQCRRRIPSDGLIPDGEGLSARWKRRWPWLVCNLITFNTSMHTGTGTPNNDQSESAAMRRLFGNATPFVSSTKSFTGHTTSASGSIETVICLLAMKHRFCPVNLNWQNADDD